LITATTSSSVSGLTRGAFDEEARFLLAAKLYEVGRLRLGASSATEGS